MRTEETGVRLRSTETQCIVVEVEGVIDVHYASLTSQGVQNKEVIQMVTHPDINLVQQGLTSVNGRKPLFPFGDSRTTFATNQMVRSV